MNVLRIRAANFNAARTVIGQRYRCIGASSDASQPLTMTAAETRIDLTRNDAHHIYNFEIWPTTYLDRPA